MHEIAGLSIWTFLSITIIGSIIVLLVLMYGILWLMAKNYEKKNSNQIVNKETKSTGEQNGKT